MTLLNALALVAVIFAFCTVVIIALAIHAPLDHSDEGGDQFTDAGGTTQPAAVGDDLLPHSAGDAA